MVQYMSRALPLESRTGASPAARMRALRNQTSTVMWTPPCAWSPASRR